jgi:methionyl-tRNA synthetase
VPCLNLTSLVQFVGNMNKFYITNAIPYVNAKPHIGHALEFIQSDTIARYHKFILGVDDVALTCGYDENSLKNVQAAEAEGISVAELVDGNGKIFHDLWLKLGAAFDSFTKGSSPQHIKSSQKLWELCEKNGDIYKKKYTGLYCVGCETFYTKDELDENGQCYEHPGKPVEEVSEENYFFKLSKYTKHITSLIESEELKIIPQFRKNEILSFVKKGLDDISISRSNERARNWGVPVPGDNNQIMYVWFDALNIYQTSVGFANDDNEYEKWWPADLHVIGKGITRFHAVYWPAFLLSAGLKLPKALFVHEYITVNGQKMSKTLGNVLDPFPLIEQYGADALRYYMLAKISPFSDGDFSEEKLKEVYNADLANGLGNLVARVAKLCEINKVIIDFDKTTDTFTPAYHDYLKKYEFNNAIGEIWKQIKLLDTSINFEQPWNVPQSTAQEMIRRYVAILHVISQALKPFLPNTADKIITQLKGPTIKSGKPLFPRI